uniref:SFRICE_034246 n=1 Tax=Spodoptera frugiperda TaxID=7108 RepID=A0A2H1WAA8_SPOFR
MKIVPENFDRVSIYPTAPEGGLCFSRVCMYVCIIVWHALQPKRLDEFWLARSTLFLVRFLLTPLPLLLISLVTRFNSRHTKLTVSTVFSVSDHDPEVWIPDLIAVEIP